jgi:hypothetical protein
MFALRVRFLMLIVGIIFLFAAGCVPNSTNEVSVPVVLGIRSTPANGTPLVRIEWTYRDDQRLGVELSVTNYPLPQGLQTTCPLTQLEVKSHAGKSLLLYRNPEEISLDEFYAITRRSRWYCKEQSEGDGFADYLFSLIYYYGGDTEFDWNTGAWLRVELGEVIATNSISVMTLANQRTLDLPLDFGAGSNNLTWLPATTLTKNDISVRIERVAMNPSFALLDACIEYQDHHFWRPIAAISYQDQVVYSTEFLPTFPPNPSDRDSILRSTRRCYSFSIPLDFPINTVTPFQIGINRVQIMNDDPGVVTMQECEAVKQRVETEHSGLKISCYEFETRGQKQHWFEILSHPSGMSAQEAYQFVESNFIKEVVGPWYMKIR